MFRPTAYKLYYFPARGNAEIIRQILSVAGKSFVDERVQHDKWPQLKPKMQFGTLPVLEVDGFQLSQTYTIARYLARKFGLAGEDDWTEAQVDSYTNQWIDFMNDVRPFTMVVIGHSEDDLNQTIQEVLVPAIDKHFPYFVKAIELNETGSGYIAGAGLTYVDLLVAEYVANAEKFVPELLATYPTLKEHSQKVRSNENLKKWLETRPVTPY